MIPLALFLAATWVGNDGCRPCHAEIVAKYSRTPMARSSGPVTTTHAGSFTHAGSGTSYTMTADSRVRFNGGERRLDWYIGSGAAGQSFVYAFNGYLFQAPVTWYAERGSWDMSPGYERDTSTRWNRPIDANCLYCHASQTRPIYGTENRFAVPPIAQAGVGCERCHGLASEHVASGGKILPVNPARLDPVRRDSVCSQCHLSGEARINRAGKSIAMYRAGDLLSDYVSVFVTPQGNTAVRATGYVEKLEQSACKRVSGDKLWCGTCHDPHEVPEPKVAAAWFREKCRSCHTAQQCERGPDCRSCHMPRARAIDGGHGVLTDHSIQRRPATTVSRRQTAQPTALQPFRGFDSGPRELGLAWAEVGDLKKAMSLLSSLKNMDAEAKSRLADIFSRSGDPARALTLYREAYAAGLETPFVLVNLGTLEAQAGNLARARELWIAALKRNPALREAAVNLEKIGGSQAEVETARKLALGQLP